MSNRAESIITPVDVVFPTAYHCYYARHFADNIKKKFQGAEVIKLFKEATHAYK